METARKKQTVIEQKLESLKQASAIDHSKPGDNSTLIFKSFTSQDLVDDIHT